MLLLLVKGLLTFAAFLLLGAYLNLGGLVIFFGFTIAYLLWRTKKHQ